MHLGGTFGCLMSVTTAIVVTGCYAERRETVEWEAEGEVRILERTPHLRTFPCVEQCHAEREPNTTARTLDEFHTLRSIQHGESMFWCNFCHKPTDLDKLHLLDGTEVPFDNAYRLCGQCHGDRLRDFELGIHGLTTGSYNGLQERRSCPVCHDPHDPHRPTFQALPPPISGPGGGDDHHE